MQMQALQLRPCIAEILRTCVLPPSLKLQVDRVVPIRPHRDENHGSPDGKSDGSAEAVRAYLSDGHLTIQALLRPSSDHPLDPGDLLELTNFEVRRSRKINGSGFVVYLAVNIFLKIDQQRATNWETEGGFIREESVALSQSPSRKRPLSPTTDFFKQDQDSSGPTDSKEPSTKRLHFENLPPSSQLPSMSSPDSAASDKEDHFETITPNRAAIERRREALREFQPDSTLALHSIQAKVDEDTEQNDTVATPSYPRANGSIDPAKRLQPPTTQSRGLADLPVHTLASLVHPHVRLPKSYHCTVFGIITWVSPNVITKPPFPPKRHIKIHDISTSNQWTGITLAVFVDARDFHPELGTVALFRGVTMQRFGDEVILNAYKTLKDREEDAEWLVGDVSRLEGEGWDVQGLKAWWRQRQQSRPSSRGSDKGPVS